ncbi:MAG TPA: TetR/AcrR family transcriptional regulator [Thermomicrobiales bacterium]|nr:TetR/AcrR family transcriptional regulator [Thermomicrobiales bacterium]
MTDDGKGTASAADANGEAGVRPSVWDRPERPARPDRNALSREQIVRAAIELIDREGPEALSMRRLAASMGVGAMSLYWHVERKADLLELVADAIFGELDLPVEPSGDWRTDLRLIALATRALFIRHPWLLQSMGSGVPHTGPNFLRHVEFTFASLARLGVPMPMMLATAGAVDSYVFGSTLEQAMEANLPSDPDERSALSASYIAAIDRGDYPTLSTMRDIFLDWNESAEATEERFIYGLDALLDGLGRRLSDAGYLPCTEEHDDGEAS